VLIQLYILIVNVKKLEFGSLQTNFSGKLQSKRHLIYQIIVCVLHISKTYSHTAVSFYIVSFGTIRRSIVSFLSPLGILERK